jgi:hypothetical protein
MSVFGKKPYRIIRDKVSVKDGYFRPSSADTLPLTIYSYVGDIIAYFTKIGKLFTKGGIRAECAEWGDAITGYPHDGYTAEHSGLTGSYDHTGGTYEQLFTCTTATFTQDDADNHNWIHVTSGTKEGATAAIGTYISTTEVLLDTQVWDADLSAITFSIFPAPVFCSKGKNIFLHPRLNGRVRIQNIGACTTDTMVEIECEAGQDGIDVLEVFTDAGGYNNITGICNEYKTGDMQPADYCDIILTNIDESGAVNADATTIINGQTFRTTDSSLAYKRAINIGNSFDEALRVQGSIPEAVTKGYTGVTATSTITDRTVAFLAETPVTMFAANNDYLIIGHDNPFETLEVILTTVGSTSITPVIYYSKDVTIGTWGVLTPKADGTNGFTSSGKIIWSAPAAWAKTTKFYGNTDLANHYYIAIKRTKTSVPTRPVSKYFKTYETGLSGMYIDGKGCIILPTLAIGDAPIGSIYFSVALSKVVYKSGALTENAFW